MRNLQLRLVVSAIALFSTVMVTMTANAAPIRFNQIVQIVNAKPGTANSGGFAQLRLVNGEFVLTDDGDDKDDDESGKSKMPQDNRVITETRSEIVEDEVCDCAPIDVPKAGFPKYALLGLAAIPLIFLLTRAKYTPTPTPTPPGMTPTPTPPGMTPTPTPTPPGMTPTPTVTPTPPEPVPEPMTLLLFGTGLASVGIAARKKFRKKNDEVIEE